MVEALEGLSGVKEIGYGAESQTFRLVFDPGKISLNRIFQKVALVGSGKGKNYQALEIDPSEDDTKGSENFFLEEVNIEGFKSFSELTNMGFQPRIGVIVGNNGVGKSNILDAVVWAMGEDDLARLRCYERDELFFSGSKNYPPASRIRVELIFKRGTGKKAPALRLVRETRKDGRDLYWIQDEPLNREQ